MRLNGWQRIGVVASVLWLPVGWIYGIRGANDAYVTTTSGVWEYVLIAMFVPLVAAWGLACGALLTVRWVRAGFQR